MSQEKAIIETNITVYMVPYRTTNKNKYKLHGWYIMNVIIGQGMEGQYNNDCSDY